MCHRVVCYSWQCLLLTTHTVCCRMQLGLQKWSSNSLRIAHGTVHGNHACSTQLNSNMRHLLAAVNWCFLNMRQHATDCSCACRAPQMPAACRLQAMHASSSHSSSIVALVCAAMRATNRCSITKQHWAALKIRPTDCTTAQVQLCK